MSNNEYTFKILSRAINDLDGIFYHINNVLYNSPAANALMDKFDRGFENICKFPFSCPAAQTERLYRKLIVDDYIAFYRIDETNKSVVVFRILYGMMDCDKYL